MASYLDVRKTVTEEQVRAISELVVKKLLQRMVEKGPGSFVHIHEVMGCLQEEWYELIDASHRRSHVEVLWELEDLAVAAIFSIASVALIGTSQR